MVKDKYQMVLDGEGIWLLKNGRRVKFFDGWISYNIAPNGQMYVDKKFIRAVRKKLKDINRKDFDHTEDH